MFHEARARVICHLLATSMKTKRHLCLALLFFAVIGRTNLRAGETYLSGNLLGRDSFQHINQTDPAGGTISADFSGTYGHVSGSASPGQVRIDAHLFGDISNDASDSGGLTGHWVDSIAVTPSDPALNGTTGTIRILYHLRSSVLISNCALSGPVFYNVDVGPFSAQGSYADSTTMYSGQPMTNLTDFNVDIGFTFGTPLNWQSDLSVDGSSSPINGNAAVILHAALTSGNITVLDKAASPVSYTSVSSLGVSAGTNMLSGQSFAGFSVTNSISNQTTAGLLGGNATTNTCVTATFIASPNTNTLVSDALDLSGTGTNLFVLQMNYDPIVAALKLGSPTNILLLWQNPLTSTFVNAIEGNSTDAAHFFSGPYNPATEFQLGNFGLDTTQHVVWAVLNHNSRFAVGQPFAPASVRLASIDATSDHAALTVSGPAGDATLIEVSTDLAPTNWTTLGLINFNTNGFGTIADKALMSVVTNRFYRARQ